MALRVFGRPFLAALRRSSSSNASEAAAAAAASPGKYAITFTCNKCKHRQQKIMSKHAYHKGESGGAGVRGTERVG